MPPTVDHSGFRPQPFTPLESPRAPRAAIRTLSLATQRPMTPGVMTATHYSERSRTGRWRLPLERLRLLLAAAAILFVGLWVGGVLAALPALAGFALVVAAALIGAASAEATPAALRRDEPPALGISDPLIDAVLAGLPDPVVALNRQGDVVALNLRAGEVAPALRRGEPVSLGLRVPEVLDAIRRARASMTPQRASSSSACRSIAGTRRS